MIKPGETFQLEGETYIAVHIPDWLCKSTLINEHVTQGDLFAVEVRTGNLRMFSKMFTSMLQTACVYPVETPPSTDTVLESVEECRAKLRQIAIEIRAMKGNKL